MCPLYVPSLLEYTYVCTCLQEDSLLCVGTCTLTTGIYLHVYLLAGGLSTVCSYMYPHYWNIPTYVLGGLSTVCRYMV